MNTFMAKAEDVERKWYVIDADGLTLGRPESSEERISRSSRPIQIQATM